METGGANLRCFVRNNVVTTVDYLGLILFAFDGTGQDANNLGRPWTGGAESNVKKLRDSYASPPAFYYPGVGSSALTYPVGGVTGAGVGSRLREAWQALKRTLESNPKDQHIDIIGFSRGAATARAFANLIDKRGDPRRYRPGRWIREGEGYQRARQRYIRAKKGCALKIRFVGIFDTVAAMGWPLNLPILGDVNIGVPLRVPKNVEHVRHAVSRHERRAAFQLTPIDQTATRVQKWFNGVHTDVGGGYANDPQLSHFPLKWMADQGRGAGVPFDSFSLPGPCTGSNCGPNGEWPGHDSSNGNRVLKWWNGVPGTRRQTPLP